MELELIGHAQVLLRTADARIWTDPWLSGTAFNGSWRLWPEPAFPPERLDEVDFLWISHEHPDHFHLPTLRALPAAFRRRVTVLFQDLSSDKVVSALRRLGFHDIRPLRHRARTRLRPATEVCLYQVGQMDSALWVSSGGASVLNLNDCEVSDHDLSLLRADLGPVDVLLGQFSMAGYLGHVDRARVLPVRARQKLDALVRAHRALGAGLTVPFASLVYFCTTDNRYMNEFANWPRDVARRFAAEDLGLAVLYPGDRLQVGAAPPPLEPALARYDAARARVPGLPYDDTPPLPLPELERTFAARAERLRARYPGVVLRALGSLTVRVPDLAVRVRLSFGRGAFDVLPAAGDADLEVRSQPLQDALAHPWGLQTLCVSARLVLLRDSAAWRAHRLLFALDNADIALRPGQLFTRRNARHLLRRWRGGVAQVLHRLRIRET